MNWWLVIKNPLAPAYVVGPFETEDAADRAVVFHNKQQDARGFERCETLTVQADEPADAAAKLVNA